MKKRAICIVVDSMGCGALDDAQEFGDSLNCNTIKNIADIIEDSINKRLNK